MEQLTEEQQFILRRVELEAQELDREELIEAFWSTANAAWVCDDDLNQDSAIACRIKALEIIDTVHENDQKILEEDDDEILQIDLYWFID